MVDTGVATESPLLLALDLTGTFAFGLNGALTAVRAARLDVVGVVSLGMITALGGGVIRDVIIGSIPIGVLVYWLTSNVWTCRWASYWVKPGVSSASPRLRV